MHSLVLSLPGVLTLVVAAGVSPGGRGKAVSASSSAHSYTDVSQQTPAETPNHGKLQVLVSRDFHPVGIFDNSPAFQRWVRAQEISQVPEGRLNDPTAQPSLRDLFEVIDPRPSVQTLGYSRPSLRDENPTSGESVLLGDAAEIDLREHPGTDRGGKMPIPTAGGTPAATNLVIGLLLPEKEPLSQSLREGALLGVENCERNDHLAVNLVIRGAVGQWGTDGVEAARMVLDENAQALIAPPDGAGSHLSLQVSGRTATPVVSLCSDSSVTQTGVPWVVRITPRTSDEAETIFSGLSSTTRVWVACVPEGRRGREITRDLAQAAEASKISLQKTIELKWPIDDLTAFSTRLLTNHVDGIVLWLDPIPAASLLKSLKAAGFTGRVAGPGSLRCRDFENLAGSAMETVILVSPVRHKDTEARFQRFAADFRSRFSREPDAIAAMGYDASQLLVQILYRAKGRPAHELFPVKFAFPGVTGVLSFDALGNRKVELELREGRDGRLVGTTQTAKKR